MKELVWFGITFASLECLKTKQLGMWWDWCGRKEVKLESLGALMGNCCCFISMCGLLGNLEIDGWRWVI